jgi:hypothetical protein
MEVKFRVVENLCQERYEVHKRKMFLFWSKWEEVNWYGFTEGIEESKTRAFKKADLWVQNQIAPKVVAEYASEVVYF